MSKKTYEETPTEILDYIAAMAMQPRGALIDPCAGSGEALTYLAYKWNMARYAIESDETRYNLMQKRDTTRPVKAMNERASGVYARGFAAAYVFPPPDTTSSQAVKWIEWTTESLSPGGVGIFRLHKRALHNPEFMVTLLKYFDRLEIYTDPPGHEVSPDLFVVSGVTKQPIDRKEPVIEELQELAKLVEHATPLNHRVRAYKFTYSSLGFQFRIRGLEWEDVIQEVYEYSWPRMQVPFARSSASFSSNLRHYRKIMREDPDSLMASLDQLPSDYAGTDTSASVWCDALAAQDRGIYVLSLIGRRVHIELVEHGLKASAYINVGSRKGKFIGGGSNWQENYHNVVVKLPSGGFHSVWFYRNATAKPIDIKQPLFTPLDDVVGAEMMANVTGLPIPPEWVDQIIKKKRGVDRRTTYRVDGTFLYMYRESTMEDLTYLAKKGLLPEPKKRQPKILRPIMTPNIGIWAQLAMQEFVNDIPLPGGIIMHSKPIELIDTEVSEALDQRIEVTEIIRKDAVSISVFHYQNHGLFSPGDWEIYQTETAEMFDAEEEDEDEFDD